MSFAQKVLRFTFQLGQGAFGQSGTNTFTVSGLRASVHIANSQGLAYSETTARVFGMTLAQMNELTSQANMPGLPAPQIRWNNMLIEAGDVGSTLTPVFAGFVQLASVETEGMPDVALEVYGNSGSWLGMQAGLPVSLPGNPDVTVVLAEVLKATNPPVALESNLSAGITLATPYLRGSVKDQVDAVRTAGNFEATMTPAETLAVWPKGGMRNLPIVPISPSTGMVGYPRNLANYGVHVKTLFNPALVLGVGVKLNSSLAFANGVFAVYGVSHHLESEMPGGAWFTEFDCFPVSA